MTGEVARRGAYCSEFRITGSMDPLERSNENKQWAAEVKTCACKISEYKCIVSYSARSGGWSVTPVQGNTLAMCRMYRSNTYLRISIYEKYYISGHPHWPSTLEVLGISHAILYTCTFNLSPLLSIFHENSLRYAKYSGVAYRVTIDRQMLCV